MINNSVKTEYAIALGFFDGLHRAHDTVLENTLRIAKERGFTPAVLLFDKHPRAVIARDAVPSLLGIEERNEKLKAKGFTLLFVSFCDIMNMSPEEFFRDILCENFGARALVCGFNYTFGKKAAGNVNILRELCEKKGIHFHACPEFTIDGNSVSSTRIRAALKTGETELANEMLGFPFGFTAPVFTGDQRGRLLGAPTINQYIPEELVTPKFGVYASKVYFDGKEYVGVTNIGARPTFGVSSVRSETYIVDFSGDLYGKSIRVELYSFMRDEKKFPDADALKKQIAQDVASALKYFA